MKRASEVVGWLSENRVVALKEGGRGDALCDGEYE